MTNNTSYDRSFYEQQSKRSLKSAFTVLSRLFPILNPKRIVDIGCGVGPWVRAAQELGAQTALGVDGAYIDPTMLMISPTQFRSANLETDNISAILAPDLTEPFDLAFSLETAEHLPYHRAESFVHELTKLSDVILFSAAIPFQTGTHHINEQWPEFWALLFKAQGYECWDWLRKDLWESRDLDWWYAQNILVFAKTGSHAAGLLPRTAKVEGQALAFVHPEAFLNNLLGNPRRYRNAARGEEIADFHIISAAYQQQENALPEFISVTRAANAAPHARDVFPFTRTEVFNPEAQAHEANKQYETMKMQLNNEINNNLTKILSLQQQYAELEKQTKDETNKRLKTDETIASLRAAVDDLCEKNAALKQALRDEREHRSTNVSSLQMQIEMVKKEQLLQARLNEFEQKLEELKQAKAKAEENKNGPEQTKNISVYLQKAQEDLHLETEKCKVLSHNLQEARNYTKFLEEQINNEKSALIHANQEIENKNLELAMLYNSRSWRVTKILRSTKKILYPHKQRQLYATKQEYITISQSVEPEYPVVSQPSEPINEQYVHNEPAVAAMPEQKPASLPPAQLPQVILSRKTKSERTSKVFPNLRVLIITPDIHGPIRNGGIGTAFGALAQQISEWGGDISVAYALGHHSENEPISYWAEYYDLLGVNFIILDNNPTNNGLHVDASDVRRLSWQTYRWLADNEGSYDLVIFPEWMGLAYYSLVAKGQGLAFKNLLIAINTHSPDLWAMEGNYKLPEYLDIVDRDFMERESVRRADYVISPSQYMYDWMREHKWHIARNHTVIQNLMPDDVHTIEQNASISKQRPEVLAFFGRLEIRKGLKLFCDAIDRLPPTARAQLKTIRFLGKVVNDRFNSVDYIYSRSKKWGLEIEILTDKNKDQAIAELLKPAVLAVIPSLVENSPYTVLECMHYGISFLASKVGGIPELINPDDHESCLFLTNPKALANSIEASITNGIAPARMACSQKETKSLWLEWFKTIPKTTRPVNDIQVAISNEPLVSVCVVHYNRPKLLSQALSSLKKQSYQNIEVILVDDGSHEKEALDFLEELEPDFKERGWKIIRQSNSYLGAARNTAALAASGEYLLFMDDDNIAMPNEIKVFVAAAQHSDADILTCVIAPFSDFPPIKPNRVWLPLGGSIGSGLYQNAFGDANAFWKRSAFIKYGNYTTDYGVGHEDWELFGNAVLCGAKLEVVPEPLCWYRESQSGMLRSGNENINLARNVRAYVKNNPSGLGVALAYAASLHSSR